MRRASTPVSYASCEISRTIASPRSRWATNDGRAGTFSISAKRSVARLRDAGSWCGSGVWSFSTSRLYSSLAARGARVALGVEAVVVRDVAVRLAGQRRVADGRVDTGRRDGVAEVVGRRPRAPRRRSAAPRPAPAGASWRRGTRTRPPAPCPGRAAPCRRSRAPPRARCSSAGPAGRRRRRARTGPCGSRPLRGWSRGAPTVETPNPRSLRCGSFRACASSASASFGLRASMSSAAASISGSGSRGLRSAVTRSAARAPLSAVPSRPAAASRSAPMAVLNSGLARSLRARAPLRPATFCADASAAANVVARRGADAASAGPGGGLMPGGSAGRQEMRLRGLQLRPVRRRRAARRASCGRTPCAGR